MTATATKLTANKIINAKPRKGADGTLVRTEIPDAGKPGLYLVIQPNGKKSWAVRYRRQGDGRPRKYTLDGNPSLAVAHKRAQEVLDAIADGADPATEKREIKRRAQISELTDDGFAAVARRFIDGYARKQTKTWRQTARALGFHVDKVDGKTLLAFKGGLAEKWGKRRLDEIAKRDVLDLLDRIVEERGGIAANRTLAHVRKLYNWAIGKDYTTTSPCTGVTAPAPETSRDRVLSNDEIRWLWQSADGLGYLFGSLVKLLLVTAQRLSEVAGMTRGELQTDRMWAIPADRAKNGRATNVPLSDEALAILASVPKIASKPGFIFTTTGDTPVSGFSKVKEKLDEAMLALAKQEAGSDAEIPRWTLHDLRRTAASGMAELGQPIHVVEAILNHKSGTIRGVAAVYNRYTYSKEKRGALEAWSRRLAAIIDPGQAGNIVAFPATG